MRTEPKVTMLEEHGWYVRRHAIMDEVEEETADGVRIRFRVKIWDDGRDPFITQWFNDPTPARDFMDRVKYENERYHNIREGVDSDGS